MTPNRTDPAVGLPADPSGAGALLPFLAGDTPRARFETRPAAPVELPMVDRLLAGAAEADLTPPPGLPKAGYSRNAHLGTGFRTRLKARVVHLRAGHASVAIVACDLLGGSAVLQHLVAAAVADRTDVPLAGLFIGATHTHAAPGQFLGTDFYNRFASNKPGFDPAWTHFLVERIAGAVVAAVETRRPARLALGATEVWGVTRNRSLAAHVRNETVPDARAEAQRAYAAVNPRLDLLRVDLDAPDGGTEPLAALAVFSVHGTGVPQRSDLYNADVWAYVVGELADQLADRFGERPVVGAIQGTHADVAPALRPGQAGHREAARVGRAIGAEAAALHARLDGRLRADVRLGCGLWEVDLAERPTVGGLTLPDRPAVGASLVAGAYENETPVLHRIPPFRAGTPKPWGAGGPQGAKWILGGERIQAATNPVRWFPRVLPVQVLRIGSTALVGLPFEITVESGRRIGAAVAAALGPAGDGPTTAVVSSVANEYSGYCTTPEEYARQHYEGGHTLYGPQTQGFLAACAAELATNLTRWPVVSRTRPVRRFNLAVQRYLPEPPAAAGQRRLDGPARFTDTTGAADACWEQVWFDTAPGGLRWHEPLVRVEAGGSDGWEPARQHGHLVDDSRPEVEVVHLGEAPGGHRYAVRWWDSAFAAHRPHRFVLPANAGQPELPSEPFD